MEGHDRKPDWSYWWRFEPSWKLTPEDRRWLSGDVDVAISRGIGCILAALFGGAMAVKALLWTGHAGASFPGLAMAIAFPALGVLLLRGEKSAPLGLMALYTTEVIVGHLASYLRGDGYYMHHLALWLCGGFLAWAIWMHVFYVAYRAELRCSIVGNALLPDTAIPPVED